MARRENRKEEKDDPDSRLAMVLLRYLKGWDQAELAQAARIAPSQVSVYDRGERPIPREVLERIADATDFPRYLLDPLLRAIRSFRLAAQGRTRAGRVLGDVFFAELAALIQGTVDLVFEGLSLEEPEVRPPAAEDREEAAERWRRLERLTAEERLVLVEEVEEFQTWALCERVAATSLEAVPDDPARALELAGLALQIAERSPGEEAWRQRLQGYAWAHVSKARRACGDLPGAEEALAQARELWEAGAPGDPGLLSGECLL